MSKSLHIAMLVIAVLVILLLLCLGGCSLTQRTNTVDFIYSNGGCLLYLDGLSVEQVGEASRNWVFDEDCDISISTIVD